MMGKVLGVDLGLSRTGVAVSDISRFLASPHSVISEKKTEKLAEKIAEIVLENKVGQIVIGLPKNMDGSEGESALRARKFADMLGEMTGVSVDLYDERLSTSIATRYLNSTDVRGKKRKAVVDAVAATVILQDFLDANK